MASSTASTVGHGATVTGDLAAFDVTLNSRSPRHSGAARSSSTEFRWLLCGCVRARRSSASTTGVATGSISGSRSAR